MNKPKPSIGIHGTAILAGIVVYMVAALAIHIAVGWSEGTWRIGPGDTLLAVLSVNGVVLASLCLVTLVSALLCLLPVFLATAFLNLFRVHHAVLGGFCGGLLIVALWCVRFPQAPSNALWSESFSTIGSAVLAALVFRFVSLHVAKSGVIPERVAQ